MSVRCQAKQAQISAKREYSFEKVNYLYAHSEYQNCVKNKFSKVAPLILAVLRCFCCNQVLYLQFVC